MKSLAFAVVLTSSIAHADPCADAFSRASDFAQRGKLVDARKELLRCAEDSCPAAMRPLCVEDMTKLEPRVPTIVLAATESGAEVFDVRVTIDGALVAEGLDGKALAIDPGMHAFHVERAGASVDKNLVVREGEKNRVLSFALVPRVVAPPVVITRRPVPWSVVLTSGLTVVSAGLWIGFGASGLAQRSTLDACKGHCEASAVSSAELAFAVADIAAVSTIAFATLTAILFATRPSVIVTPTATEHGAGIRASVTF